MQIEVKALDQQEFEAAETGEYVCATWTLHTGSRLKTSYLYIRLGRQVTYTKTAEKYSQTRFKKFIYCDIEAYQSLEELDSGSSTNKASGIDVTLFY